ncbi:hypothetical protein T190115A13A_150008 [Tenacibaculum sp. 190524A02b]|uniref:Uncharacterized protein n=1 Tax=Tenacibaculum vairaonense TaxID=3137860 RepID=A0ABM9PID4_9FLAO
MDLSSNTVQYYFIFNFFKRKQGVQKRVQKNKTPILQGV